MQPDIEKYRGHLRDLGLAAQHEDEILRALWTILQGFVDRAFDGGPLPEISMSEHVQVPSKESPVTSVTQSLIFNAVSKGNKKNH